MVSNYKRKTNRGAWNEKNMERALQAVAEKRMGWLKASRYYQVPQATLRRRAMNRNKIAVGTTKHLGRHETTLNRELEEALVEHMLALEARFFGSTTVDVRILAYEFALRMKLKHQFNNTKKIAGKGWLRSFRLRHPNISLRQPEATSMARAESFNKPQVKTFFKNLRNVINNEEIDKSMIFNMDESGLTTVQNTSKIFALKGKKQVGAITSGERGVYSTVVACMSSGGTYIPPAIIFPRKKFNPTLYDGAPLGTLCLYNESGYMTGELFLKWMEHFIKHVRPNTKNKALLILDGHVSHKNLEALELAKNNSVVLFCLPSHCTHRLQPLDVCFFEPLSNYYDAAATQWLKENPSRVITLYQVASLFSSAYNKTAIPTIALSGFKATGILPFNPDIFPEHMYLPSTVTDVPLEADNANTESLNPGACFAAAEHLNEEDPQSSTTVNTKPHERVESSANNVTNVLLQISPLPQGNARKSRRRKANSYQDVLTTSPYLQSLREQQNIKKAREVRGNKQNSVKKNVFDGTLECGDKDTQKDCRDKTTGKLRKSERSAAVKIYENKSDYEEPFNDDDDDDCACLYCNELYSLSKCQEGWLRCQMCKMWAHAECAGLSMKAKNFICELCCDN
ncbi:uncharacterized protein LOC126892621 [Diabrotica virgifera virgifera]|uniref:HTH CENPB-type domain-containing protein n=1 Tax=Diabrotica virgifera virgifera TaxID=50390 RepID=A0ABM5L6X2_DIAVI|nr:uncharacterized protein LOC126892621 [Diabrotica virgifera virgifera]